MCDPYRADGKTYMCGRALENKRPKLRRDDGCPGGYMVCNNCADTAARFLDEAYNASAIRKEWQA